LEKVNSTEQMFRVEFSFAIEAGKIQLKKRKIHVDKTGNGKYNNLCACERNLLAAIK